MNKWSLDREILPALAICACPPIQESLSSLAIFVNGVRLAPEEIRYNKDGHFLDLTVPFKNS